MIELILSRLRSFTTLVGNERGAWPLVYSLIVLPFMLLLWVGSSTQLQTVTTGDFDIQEDIEVAARAAAGMVTPYSEASGDPRIDPDRAHEEFKRTLANNLGLDPTTLAPLDISMIAELDYTMVVYNIDAKYAPAGTIFSTIKPNNTFNPSGSSYIFGINEGDITPGSTGKINTTRDKPSVIVSVTAKMRRTMGKDDVIIHRWVPVEIVRPQYNYT